MFKAFAVGKHHLHTFTMLLGYKINTIGIFLQVVSDEVNPKMEGLSVLKQTIYSLSLSLPGCEDKESCGFQLSVIVWEIG